MNNNYYYLLYKYLLLYYSILLSLHRYNTYYYSAVPGGFLDYDTSDENGRDHSGTAIKVEPKFVNAANGDFTLSSSEHIANRCGDPRWLPTTE